VGIQTAITDALLNTVLIPLLIIAGIIVLNLRAERRKPTSPIARHARLRHGLAALPLYYLAVGAGHAVLARVSDVQTIGLSRDGQAFLGTWVLGVVFMVLAILIAPFAIQAERSVGALVRGALAALAVAAGVVAYTVSRGYEVLDYERGPVIGDARPDVAVIILAAIGAYAVSHIAARLSASRAEKVTAAAPP
jgi:hypothetical protein